jgi:hypothetical protein
MPQFVACCAGFKYEKKRGGNYASCASVINCDTLCCHSQQISSGLRNNLLAEPAATCSCWLELFYVLKNVLVASLVIQIESYEVYA